jgi:hypothetical protein
MRKMGFKTFSTVHLFNDGNGSLALMGFPFLRDFTQRPYFRGCYGKYTSIGYFSYCLGTMEPFLQLFYSVGCFT